jgi:hypothetical protein
MLKEVVPTMRRVALLQNSDHPAWAAYLSAINRVACDPCCRVHVL